MMTGKEFRNFLDTRIEQLEEDIRQNPGARMINLWRITLKLNVRIYERFFGPRK